MIEEYVCDKVQETGQLKVESVLDSITRFRDRILPLEPEGE